MSLKAIVDRLGGDLYDGGRRASIPAPGHSRADRSVSLLQTRGRILIHSFGAADWREVRDALQELGLSPSGDDEERWRALPSPADSLWVRRAAALRIWDAAAPLGRTLSARHCARRGISALPCPGALRHGARTPLSVYRSGGATWPALLAAVRDPQGDITAVEITYLDSDGRRAGRLALSRKIAGCVPEGAAVRLWPAAANMLVAEGVFTTLSACERFGLPGWALTSAGNLRRWRAPAGVERVLIAADRGRVGEAAAADLRRSLMADGVAAEVARPPAPFGDWNEAAQADGPRKGWRKGGEGRV